MLYPRRVEIIAALPASLSCTRDLGACKSGGCIFPRQPPARRPHRPVPPSPPVTGHSARQPSPSLLLPCTKTYITSTIRPLDPPPSSAPLLYLDRIPRPHHQRHCVAPNSSCWYVFSLPFPQFVRSHANASASPAMRLTPQSCVVCVCEDVVHPAWAPEP